MQYVVCIQTMQVKEWKDNGFVDVKNFLGIVLIDLWLIERMETSAKHNLSVLISS